jgi:hypothetical protein
MLKPLHLLMEAMVITEKLTFSRWYKIEIIMNQT